MTLLAMPAFAQIPRAGGPFAGLFGGMSDTGHTLDLRGSGFGVYQETFLPASVPIDEASPFLDRQGSSLGGSASLAYGYRRMGEGSSLYFGSRGSASKFSARAEEWPWDASANVGVTTQLSQKISFSGSADGLYTPYYGFPSFDQGFSPITGFGQNPGLVGQPGFNAVLFEPSLNYGAQASINSKLTRRTSMFASADWRHTRMFETGEQSTRQYSLGGGINHQLWRYVGVHAGYRRQVSTSEFPGSPRIASNIIDAGVDFNYSGSFEIDRRTTFTFGTSSSLITSAGGNTHFRVNGNAGISRAIGRTWMAQANYVRDTGYQIGFSDVLLTDSVTGGISGLIARRLSSSTSASWQRGQVGFDTGNAYTTINGTTGLNYGLTRRLGLYAQYTYFHYTTPPAGVTLPLYEDYSRQVISAGVTAFVPLLSTGRMNRDSR